MSKTTAANAFPEPEHNHGPCLDLALERAQRAFEASGSRLTELRQQVFAEIAGSHDAIGAYDVLDRLARKGTRVAPISVYRAIEALLHAGVIHRLETRNAFFACHAGHAPERGQLILLCERCGRVAEVPGEAVFNAIEAVVNSAGFRTRRTVAEVSGICADCQATS
jgi:Fur family transcriptional regulator, zinc uptake regulator